MELKRPRYISIFSVGWIYALMIADDKRSLELEIMYNGV